MTDFIPGWSALDSDINVVYNEAGYIIHLRRENKPLASSWLDRLANNLQIGDVENLLPPLHITCQRQSKFLHSRGKCKDPQFDM